MFHRPCRPHGDFGGALKDVAPAELGQPVITEAIRRPALSVGDVQHVVTGQVIQSEPKDAHMSRVAAVNAGIPVTVPALTLNRLCGSGLQAIILAAQMMHLGEASARLRAGPKAGASRRKS